MNINEFADLNEARCYSPEAKAKWGDTSERDLTDWALCVAGEAGELCNAVKKQQMYTRGSFEKQVLAENEIFKEAVDVTTYALLLLRHIGVTDIETALMRKFDEVSERIGWQPYNEHEEVQLDMAHYSLETEEYLAFFNAQLRLESDRPKSQDNRKKWLAYRWHCRIASKCRHSSSFYAGNKCANCELIGERAK